MRKVMTIVGTRPELIKMSLVIERMDRLTNHTLVHTGQNYDYNLNQVFFEDLGIRRPDHFLEVASTTAAQSIAKVIESTDRLFEQEEPDALLLYGDTNSGLAVISAKRRKIPVFHMEAGNRCFDQRVPEELNRKIIDHLSDVNLTLTEHARRYLLAEGLPADRTFVVGSHMEEVLERNRQKIENSTIRERLGLTAGRYFVISAHREENVDSAERLTSLIECLEHLVAAYQWPVIVSTHPRTRKRLDLIAKKALSSHIRFLDPFGFTDYISLQRGAACVLSDSGTITEEASLLDFPAVTLREAHERPEGVDAGTLVMASLVPERILDAVRCVMDGFDKNDGKSYAGTVVGYKGGPVSAKVARIVLSYIDQINRRVWSKTSF